MQGGCHRDQDCHLAGPINSQGGERGGGKLPGTTEVPMQAVLQRRKNKSVQTEQQKMAVFILIYVFVSTEALVT